MAQTLDTIANDPQRADVLTKARAFKRTWLELAEALTKVHHSSAWKNWGFDSFETYCRKELHIRNGTATKLISSFRFLKTEAPKVIERSRTAKAPVPTLQAVNFLAQAKERGAANRAVMQEIKHAALEEGADGPQLARRFKEVAFPLADGEHRKRIKGQLLTTARRLANLIAEPDLPISHEIATQVEEMLGVLLEALES